MGLLVLALLALLDFLRHDSLMRRAWTGVQPERTTPVQEQLQEFQRTRGESLRP
jgi:hypothetical protein